MIFRSASSLFFRISSSCCLNCACWTSNSDRRSSRSASLWRFSISSFNIRSSFSLLRSSSFFSSFSRCSSFSLLRSSSFFSSFSRCSSFSLLLCSSCSLRSCFSIIIHCKNISMDIGEVTFTSALAPPTAPSSSSEDDDDEIFSTFISFNHSLAKVFINSERDICSSSSSSYPTFTRCFLIRSEDIFFNFVCLTSVKFSILLLYFLFSASIFFVESSKELYDLILRRRSLPSGRFADAVESHTDTEFVDFVNVSHVDQMTNVFFLPETKNVTLLLCSLSKLNHIPHETVIISQ